MPIFQGPIATAMGGVDPSWLAGTATSAAVYSALGYTRFRSRTEHDVPLMVAASAPSVPTASPAQSAS
ncbi:hypothetical protein [Sinomonas terricola]|uniref:hypothetical protein n=1 Tax=Sinomonas terricola TaxID=3110330 RepID=UPI002B209623|nr:hypothetical protein [Sinomonas sp. JGH33]